LKARGPTSPRPLWRLDVRGGGVPSPARGGTAMRSRSPPISCARGARAPSVPGLRWARTAKSASAGRTPGLSRERERLPSDLEDHAVLGARLGHALSVGQHFRSEVGEHDALGGELMAARAQHRIIEVEANGLAVEVALADEEVG